MSAAGKLFFFIHQSSVVDLDPDCGVRSRNEDPVLAKNGIRGSVPQTKGDFLMLDNF